MDLGFMLHPRPPAAQIEQLVEAGVAMRTNHPIERPAAIGDGFAVQQVRRRPVLMFTIEFKNRNGLDGGPLRLKNHQKFSNVQVL